MQKQIKNGARGATYGAGVEFDSDSIVNSTFIKQIEQN